MPAKWQQWFPFQIDAFKASPSVRAMHPTARSAFIYLLAAQWQSEDCTLPTDPIALAEIAEVDDEAWSIHGPRILRKFETVGDRIRNAKQYEEWSAAKRIFDARKNAALKTNEERSPHGHRTVTDGIASRSPDTHTRTLTGTVTTTETEVPKDSCAELAKNGNSTLKGTLPLNDGSDFQITQAFIDEWQPLYPAVDVLQQLRSMKGWLISHPTKRKTRGGIKRFINKWLSDSQDKGGTYANGNGNYQDKSRTSQNRAALAAAIQSVDYGATDFFGTGEASAGEPRHSQPLLLPPDKVR